MIGKNIAIPQPVANMACAGYNEPILFDYYKFQYNLNKRNTQQMFRSATDDKAVTGIQLTQL